MKYMKGVCFMKETLYKYLDVNMIKANENQPRTHFEDEKIQELSESIKENGLLQPIVVRPYDNYYQIVVGERRYRACVLAGIKEIPCLVQVLDEDQTATAALVENIQRENLSPIEEALAYHHILDTQNITQQELAQKVGKKQSTIANKLRLLNLPITVQEAVKRKDISERHARALLSLKSTADQNKMLRDIIDHGYTVSQTEDKIKQKIEPKEPIVKKTKPKRKQISQSLKIAINTIQRAYDMITRSGVKGELSSEETEEEYIMIIKMKK